MIIFREPILLISTIILTIIAIMTIIEIYIANKQFNKGICPKCGEKLKFFDMDSQGGRGYKCPKCKYITWVSYSLVDEL